MLITLPILNMVKKIRKDLFLHVNATHPALLGNGQSLQNIKGAIYVLKHDAGGMHNKFAVLMKLNEFLNLNVDTKVLICHYGKVLYTDPLKIDLTCQEASLPIKKKKKI